MSQGTDRRSELLADRALDGLSELEARELLQLGGTGDESYDRKTREHGHQESGSCFRLALGDVDPFGCGPDLGCRHLCRWSGPLRRWNPDPESNWESEWWC